MNKPSISLPRTDFSLIIHEDMSTADKDNPKICPRCRSGVQLFQINDNEKFLMCMKEKCIWPFGCDDYHIYKIKPSKDTKTQIKSSACSDTTGSTESLASTSDWSDLDKMIINRPMSPRSMSSTPTPSLVGAHDTEKLQKIKERNKQEAMLQDNLKQIQALSKQLYEDETLEISNDKWIKQIAEMQQRSGVQLLKEDELKKAKKLLPNLGGGEFEIEIDPSKQSISLKIVSNEE